MYVFCIYTVVCKETCSDWLSIVNSFSFRLPVKPQCPKVAHTGRKWSEMNKKCFFAGATAADDGWTSMDASSSSRSEPETVLLKRAMMLCGKLCCCGGC